MPVGNIGSLYDKNRVLVGQAAGFYAPADTPLPADSITVFDPVSWLSTLVTVGAASAGNFTLTALGGPLGIVGVTTANIAWNAIATAVASALNAVLPAGYVATVTGTAPNWVVQISGPGADDIAVTGTGVALTGGAFLATASAWTPAGGTEQGWQANYAPQTSLIRIEEQQTPVAQGVDSADLTFVANLAEDSIRSLKLALSAAATVTAPDTTHFGKTRLTLQKTLPVLAVCLETQNEQQMPRRWYIPEATCATNVGVTFRRSAANRSVPVTFTSICAIDSIIIDDIQQNHT